MLGWQRWLVLFWWAGFGLTQAVCVCMCVDSSYRSDTLPQILNPRFVVGMVVPYRNFISLPLFLYAPLHCSFIVIHCVRFLPFIIVHLLYSLQYLGSIAFHSRQTAGRSGQPPFCRDDDAGSRVSCIGGYDEVALHFFFLFTQRFWHRLFSSS